MFAFIYVAMELLWMGIDDEKSTGCHRKRL